LFPTFFSFLFSVSASPKQPSARKTSHPLNWHPSKACGPPRSQVERLVAAHIVRRNKALDEVSAAIARDRVARNMEVTCDRRETGSPTGWRHPPIENICFEKYPIPERAAEALCPQPISPKNPLSAQPFNGATIQL